MKVGIAAKIISLAFVLALAMALVVDLALESAGTRPAWYQQSLLLPHLMLMENWARDTTAQLLQWLR